MRIDYRVADLADYINWVYFFHAWNVPPSSEEGLRLQAEARKMLQRLQPYVLVKAVVEILPAYGDGDDIVVQPVRLCECGQTHPSGEPVRIPMLRQQVPGEDGHCLCLSDFVRPKSAVRHDKIGVFATSTDLGAAEDFDDGYEGMLLQTLADRLAEAGAERLHETVRRELWGYAPHERLSVAELHREAFQGIRPAVGYPCLPDISINRVIDRLIGLGSIGVTLTSSAMMQPHASVSGFMISLPQARYFAVGRVDARQLADYALRRHVTFEEINKFVQCS